ncbi:MAG: hypothetical protein JOY93_09755 [Acidobacteriales bacterium]|nr:hypothetical protein [Terriglobales bacterium]
MDVAVSGPRFGASSVPSLKQFLREVARSVPSPRGGTVYDAWKASAEKSETTSARETSGDTYRPPAAQSHGDAPVGDLGSGSDYTVFLQHLGVPSADIGSTGPYGVYHSVFDNFNWFKKFGDPDFFYEQQMARVFGLESMRMADADVLPFDYGEYGKEVLSYVDAAGKRSASVFGERPPSFADATAAARNFEQAGEYIAGRQKNPGNDAAKLNRILRETERALLIPEGLPTRPWYHHAIYAPGRYTGYAAVVIPGINESIDQHDLERTRQQIKTLAEALNRAAKVLESYR